MTEPASIRFNNPGAMWGGNALTRKWGETSHVTLNDGLGQGNQIAVFPDRVHGAAAQFDLWHTSAHYHNQRLDVALKTWSGGNSWQQYANFIISRVPGLTEATIINDAFLSSPTGIAFVKAQAWHEAGKPYPMTDAEWAQAQKMVFSGTVVLAKPKTSKTTKAAGGVVVAGTVAAGVHQGWGPGQWILAAFIVVGLGAAFYFIRKNFNST